MNRFGPAKRTLQDDEVRLLRFLCEARDEVILASKPDELAGRYKLHRSLNENRRMVETKLLAAQARVRRLQEQGL